MHASELEAAGAPSDALCRIRARTKISKISSTSLCCNIFLPWLGLGTCIPGCRLAIPSILDSIPAEYAAEVPPVDASQGSGGFSGGRICVLQTGISLEIGRAPCRLFCSCKGRT